MTQISFSTDWLKRLSDPYSLLGVSVSANDQRVLRRYRNIAKVLHPDGDQHVDAASKELASCIFARLINPAYQKLKQEKERAESLALLRLQVRRLNHPAGCMVPQTEIARQLLQTPVKEAEVFYEQAIAHLISVQYELLEQFEPVTQQLNELNLVYLQLKMGEPVLREKRVGLISGVDAQPLDFAPLPESPPPPSYAQRHYQRAEEYMKKACWSSAVQELRDAIKLEPNQSDYHALVALAYLKQSLMGMAAVHFRQALKLNPRDSLALKYAAQFNIKPAFEVTAKVYREPSKSGLFGLFSGGRR